MTKVVNLYKDKYDIYIGRAGKNSDGYFGNPFSVELYGRAGCLSKFRDYFNNRIDADPEYKRRISELKDKILGCFCVPNKCHGHIYAEYLDRI